MFDQLKARLSAKATALLVAGMIAAAAAVGITLPSDDGDPGESDTPAASIEQPSSDGQTPGIGAPEDEETTTTAETSTADPDGASTTPTAVPAADGVPETERGAISEVLQAIESGPALPYDEDGQTFQNREGRLPQQPLGYYREYTVETPGSDDRGARRLVIGEGGETYYTSDHYGSFTEIDPAAYL